MSTRTIATNGRAISGTTRRSLVEVTSTVSTSNTLKAGLLVTIVADATRSFVFCCDTNSVITAGNHLTGIKYFFTHTTEEDSREKNSNSES